MASDISSSAEPKTTMRKLTSHYSNTSLFDKDSKVKLLGLTLAYQNQKDREEERQESNSSPGVPSPSKQPVVSEVMFCNCCQIQFADREEQLVHYRCDWHRYNLHLRLKGLNCVSEEEFEILSGDVSSISGSDEESEDENYVELNEPATPIFCTPVPEDEKPKHFQREQRLNKMYFKNEQGELLSLYKCLVSHKKSPTKSPSEIENMATNLVNEPKWAVIMVSSGHFAGAVFNGKDVVDHKTFHRYTVRAKRGGAQSTKDGQGNAPKSAGASLRRYNEAALNQEVQELLTSWKTHLDSCSLIFVRIPMGNRAMFYGGKNPAMKKDDLRIRVIPFPTRRPTFNELKRVQQMLSCIECYGQQEDAEDFIPVSPQRFYCKNTDKLEIRHSVPTSKESKKLNQECTPPENLAVSRFYSEEKGQTSEEEIEEDNFDLYPVGPGNPLQEFEINIGKKKRKRKPKSAKSKALPSDTLQQGVEDDTEIKNSLYTACKAGKVGALGTAIAELQTLFQGRLDSEDVKCGSHEVEGASQSHVQDEDGVKKPLTSDNSNSSLMEDNNSNSVARQKVSQLLSCPFGDKDNTLLHVASEGNHHEIVAVLLHEGADPAVKNKRGNPPYVLGNNEVRNAYRRCMALFPDKYDYKQAQIPGPLTEEMESSKKQKQAEKRAVRKKVTQEKNKTKKAEESKVKEENALKERFLNLSDREKRALAAERRILQQQNEHGGPKSVLSRCFQCGGDISGQVPFEYSDFKFCSTKCLRDHRTKSKSN